MLKWRKFAGMRRGARRVKRGAEGHFERLPALVAELVLTKVDVIVTFSYPTAAAAKEGTSTIPIVIFNAGDPVKTHLVDSLNRPAATLPAFPTWLQSSRRNVLDY
nr:ABC transporter substrate binding protein [Bradyrhizobium erythrophlei]